MNTFYSATLVILLGLGAVTGRAQNPTPFDQLKKLQGEWIDLEGVVGPKGAVLATYRLTGNGTAVVETLFPGSQSRDDDGVSPRRQGHRADALLFGRDAAAHAGGAPSSGNVLTFAFDGGTNFNPAKDEHMHNARIEFVSADEIRAEWQGWADGKAAGAHLAKMHLARKK